MAAVALQSIFPIGPSNTCTVVLDFKPSLRMSWSRRERAVDARRFEQHPQLSSARWLAR